MLRIHRFELDQLSGVEVVWGLTIKGAVHDVSPQLVTIQGQIPHL